MRERRLVVVADDDPTVLELAARMLDDAGCDVLPASCGRCALRLLRDRRCDALVVDLAMPNMDGIEAIREIRAEQPDLRIVVMTGMGRTVQEMVVRLGADVALAKPFYPDQLRTAVLDGLGP